MAARTADRRRRSSGRPAPTRGGRSATRCSTRTGRSSCSRTRHEQRPSRATVTDLETGKTFEINGRSDVPTTTGGTWALGDGPARCTPPSTGAPTAWRRSTSESRRSTRRVVRPEAARVQRRPRHRRGRLAADLRRRPDRRAARWPASPTARPRRSRASPSATAWEGLLLEDARRLVGHPARAADRGGAPLRPRRRRLLRPRPGHGGQPRAVRRRGVLHPRPAAAGRPRRR